MSPAPHSLKSLSLTFAEPAVEDAYRKEWHSRVSPYYKITWASVPFLGSLFALLDRTSFGDLTPLVYTSRLAVVIAGAIILAAAFVPRLKGLMGWSSVLFIATSGYFTILQTTLVGAHNYTPYFTGIFFAYAGAVFSMVGYGFLRTVSALAVHLVAFNLVMIILAGASQGILLVYNFFLCGMSSIFAFVAYLTERNLRQYFAVSDQLRTSLKHVKQLSGLLPICSHCQMIRNNDDSWSRLDHYVSQNSEADFSHGLCPTCARDLYPQYNTETTT